MTPIIFTSQTWSLLNQISHNFQGYKSSWTRVKFWNCPRFYSSKMQMWNSWAKYFRFVGQFVSFTNFVERELLGFSNKEWPHLPRGKIHREGKCLPRLPKAEQLLYGPLLEDCLINLHQQSIRFGTKIIFPGFIFLCLPLVEYSH